MKSSRPSSHLLAQASFSALLGLSLTGSLSAQAISPGTFSILNVGNANGDAATGDGTFAALGQHGVSPVLPANLQGPGSRLLWYPRKSAFRAGYVGGINWDESQIGQYSVAMGYGTNATGWLSTAMGQGTQATGWGSTAMGISTQASGVTSTAMGHGTQASEWGSTAMGIGTIANSYASTVVGAYNKVVSRTPNAWVPTEPLFEVGNGTSTTPSNALTVYKNGNMELQGNLTVGGTITSGGSPALTVSSALANRFVQASDTGILNLTGATPGITANGGSIFSLDSAGKVTYANNRPLAIASATESTSSTTGALTVAGGLGVTGNGNLGGSLNVAGSANFSTAGVALTGLPAGVTGTRYASVGLGNSYVTSFILKKTGDETTGDFLAPIGIFYNNGGPIEVSILPTGGGDPMAGAAYYTLASKRHGGGVANQVTALEHSAFGAGCNAKLLAYTGHGSTTLYLQLDARTYGTGSSGEQGALINIRTTAPHNPSIVPVSVASALPLKILDSTTVPFNSQTGDTLLPSVTRMSSDETIIDGNLTLGGTMSSGGSQVLTLSSAKTNGFLQSTSAGVINLTGTTPGITANGGSIFSLDSAGTVTYASNRPLAITSATESTSSTTGALTVAGGLGVTGDSYVNGIRIGRGAGSIASNTTYGSLALDTNTTGTNNAATGTQALNNNTTGSDNSATGFQSLVSNTTGNLNVALGSSAGRYHADGATALTDPESSIYIGANSRGKDNNDSNSIVIGANAIGLGMNTTVIGTTNTTRTHLHGQTTTPSLDVSGNAKAASLEVTGSTLISGATTLSGTTTLSGQVIISAPQGDIAMGIYQ